MSRYRLYPTPAQEDVLLECCAHARYVWNLAVEQRSWWQPGRPAPAFVEQCRQLSEARAANSWLAAGSVIVQQQALRDFHAAHASWFASLREWRKRCTKTKPGERLAAPAPPSWRKRGRSEGFRIVAVGPRDVRRQNHRWGEMVPKLGWVRFRWSRPVPAAKSYRVTRTKLAIARLKAREADRRRDWTEKTSTDLARRFDLICVEDLDVRAMTRTSRGTVQRPGRGVRQQAGRNRGILASGWSRLVVRLEHKAPGRVQKVAAGQVVAARGGRGAPGPVNREPPMLGAVA